MEKNRLSIMPKQLHPEIKQPIKYLQKTMEKIEKQLDKLIQETPEGGRLMIIKLSVKGVGQVLAYTLISER